MDKSTDHRLNPRVIVLMWIVTAGLLGSSLVSARPLRGRRGAG